MKIVFDKPVINRTKQHEALFQWMKESFDYENLESLFRKMESLVESYDPEYLCRYFFGCPELYERDLTLMHIYAEELNRDSHAWVQEHMITVIHVIAPLMEREYGKNIHDMFEYYTHKRIEYLKRECMTCRGFQLRDLVRDNMSTLLTHAPDILAGVITNQVSKGYLQELLSRRKCDWLDEKIVSGLIQWMDADLSLPWCDILECYDVHSSMKELVFGSYVIPIQDVISAKHLYGDKPFPWHVLISDARSQYHLDEEVILC